MKKFIKIVPFLGLVAVLCMTGTAITKISAEENATIPSTVYIGDIDVSGMTKGEAQHAVDEYIETLGSTTFTLKADDRSIQVTAEELGLEAANTDVVELALNIGKTGNLINRYKDQKDLEKEKKVFPIAFAADESKVKNVLTQNAEELNQEPINYGLKRENSKFEIIEGANGVEVNVEDSVEAVEDFFADDWDMGSGTIELVAEVAEPEGTEEELQKVQDILGSFQTNFSSSASGRYKNVQNGCERINGSVIYPGEQFSVYEKVSPFDAENGYYLAGSYENGTTVETYGGGICQVSTTLYNAVIRSELQVDERFNHSMIVNYVEPSMDAAIAGTSKDLKFTNNTDAPIYIEGYTDGGILHFSIYGEETRDSDRVVTYESETTSQTDPGVQMVASGAYPIGYIATTQSPHTGYTAKLWKVVTVNGKEVSREQFNSSKYSPSNKIITVGVASENPEAVANINAAIATGSEAAVRAAAAQWSGATAPAEAAPAPEAQPEAQPEMTVDTSDDSEKEEPSKEEGDGGSSDEGSSDSGDSGESEGGDDNKDAGNAEEGGEKEDSGDSGEE